MSNNHLAIASMLRVNHCGEYAAIRIYRAQIAWCRLFNPQHQKTLEHFLQDEIKHLAWFDKLRCERSIRTCHFLPLWGIGGYALGGFTALFGTQGIMVCTQAVEETVDRHLNEQLQYLADQALEPEVATAIKTIQIEERQHLNYAKQFTENKWLAKILYRFIVAATQSAIWLSVRM